MVVSVQRRTARRTRRNVRSLCVLTLAGSLALAGCSSGTSTGKFSLPGAAAYFKTKCPDPAVKPKQKQLTYWSMWTKGEPQGRVVQYIIKCFEKTTGVHVTVQWLGRKVLTQNLAPALNTNSVPDLFDEDVTKVKAAIVSAGGARGVNNVFDMKTGEGDTRVRDVLPKAYWDIPGYKTADGQPFLVPYEVLANAWWYNKKQVTNFHKPQTMDQLFALFDAAKKSGKAAISQDGDIDTYNIYYFSQLAERYVGCGGMMKAAKDTTGKAWTDTPGFLKAARYVQRIARGHYLIDGWDASKFPQVQQRWADGQSDYIFLGSWGPSETRQYLNKQGGGKAIDYASFQFPKPPGATHDIVEQKPIGFGITKKAKHPQTAAAFIAYFENRTMLAGIPAVADNLTPRKDLPVPGDLADIKAALDNPKYTHCIFDDGLDALHGGSWAENVLYPNNDALLRGKITAKQFVQRMADKSASYWKSHR